MGYPLAFTDFCDSMESRLTSLRKTVLFILWDLAKPLKAYEILNELQRTKNNSTAPTVYRVLDYFVGRGIVHKIESIQSYTLCKTPDKHWPSEILMVCHHCHSVVEIYDQGMRALVQKLSMDKKFHLSQDAIELKGSCYSCHSENRGAE